MGKPGQRWGSVASGPESSPSILVVKLLRDSTINNYLLAYQKFLRLISVLIYWTSGLPPRRKELIDTAWCD